MHLNVEKASFVKWTARETLLQSRSGPVNKQTRTNVCQKMMCLQVVSYKVHCNVCQKIMCLQVVSYKVHCNVCGLSTRVFKYIYIYIYI